MADDLIFNNADGSVSHKPDTINSVKSGEIKFDSIEISEGDVQDFGGVGVVTGKLVEKASYKGSDLSGSYRFLDVWIKRDGRWQNVAGQETRATNSYPPDSGANTGCQSACELLWNAPRIAPEAPTGCCAATSNRNYSTAAASSFGGTITSSTSPIIPAIITSL